MVECSKNNNTDGKIIFFFFFFFHLAEPKAQDELLSSVFRARLPPFSLNVILSLLRRGWVGVVCTRSKTLFRLALLM